MELEDVELVEKTFFTLVRDDILYPTLYDPFRRLDSFLWDNRHLFTLIGVFGAIMVYIRTVEEELSASLSDIGDFAVFSGLALLILLSLIVMANLWIEIRQVSVWESLLLYFFAALFIPLIIVISGIITAFPRVLSLYVFMIIYFLGMGTGLLIAFSAAWIAQKAENRWTTPINIVETFVVFLGVFILLITIGVTQQPPDSHFNAPLSKMLSFTDWIQLYVAFALTIGTVFLLFGLALMLLYTTGIALLYVLARCWGGIRRIWD